MVDCTTGNYLEQCNYDNRFKPASISQPHKFERFLNDNVLYLSHLIPTKLLPKFNLYSNYFPIKF